MSCNETNKECKNIKLSNCNLPNEKGDGVFHPETNLKQVKLECCSELTLYDWLGGNIYNSLSEWMENNYHNSGHEHELTFSEQDHVLTLKAIKDGQVIELDSVVIPASASCDCWPTITLDSDCVLHLFKNDTETSSVDLSNIIGTKGDDGADGQDGVGFAGVTETHTTVGLVTTYTITPYMTDGSSSAPFTIEVTNGADGDTVAVNRILTSGIHSHTITINGTDVYDLYCPDYIGRHGITVTQVTSGNNEAFYIDGIEYRAGTDIVFIDDLNDPNIKYINYFKQVDPQNPYTLSNSLWITQLYMENTSQKDLWVPLATLGGALGSWNSLGDNKVSIRFIVSSQDFTRNQGTYIAEYYFENRDTNQGTTPYANELHNLVCTNIAKSGNGYFSYDDVRVSGVKGIRYIDPSNPSLGTENYTYFTIWVRPTHQRQALALFIDAVTFVDVQNSYVYCYTDNGSNRYKPQFPYPNNIHSTYNLNVPNTSNPYVSGQDWDNISGTATNDPGTFLNQTFNVGPVLTTTSLYSLTFQAGAFSADVYQPDVAAKIINIPTTAAHILGSTDIGDSDNFIYWDGTNQTWQTGTYTASKGITKVGTDFQHTNNITAGTFKSLTPNSGGFLINRFSYDAQGHITPYNGYFDSIGVDNGITIDVRALQTTTGYLFTHYNDWNNNQKAAPCNASSLANMTLATNITYDNNNGNLVFKEWKFGWDNQGHVVEATYNGADTTIPLGINSTTGAITIGNNTITPLTNISVNDGDPTLAWGTRSIVGTVNGTALHVTMPSQPTGTTYQAADGITIDNNTTPKTIKHSNAITAGTWTPKMPGASSNPPNYNTVNIPQFTFDAQGHITDPNYIPFVLAFKDGLTVSKQSTPGQFYDVKHTNSIATHTLQKVMDNPLWMGKSIGGVTKGVLKFDMHSIEWDAQGHISSWTPIYNDYIDIFSHLVAGTGISIVSSGVGNVDYTISATGGGGAAYTAGRGIDATELANDVIAHINDWDNGQNPTLSAPWTYYTAPSANFIKDTSVSPAVITGIEFGETKFGIDNEGHIVKLDDTGETFILNNLGTVYQAGSGINIDSSTTPNTIEHSNQGIDSSALANGFKALPDQIQFVKNTDPLKGPYWKYLLFEQYAVAFDDNGHVTTSSNKQTDGEIDIWDDLLNNVLEAGDGITISAQTDQSDPNDPVDKIKIECSSSITLTLVDDQQQTHQLYLYGYEIQTP